MSALYSIVQYVPDSFRQEAVNVGVVLWCDDPEFLDVRYGDADDRIERLFGGRADLMSLAVARREFALRLRDGPRPESWEAFQELLSARLGTLSFTPLRNARGQDPAVELANLVDRAVGDAGPSVSRGAKLSVPLSGPKGGSIKDSAPDTAPAAAGPFLSGRRKASPARIAEKDAR